jgi:hypothetical protein
VPSPAAVPLAVHPDRAARNFAALDNPAAAVGIPVARPVADSPAAVAVDSPAAAVRPADNPAARPAADSPAVGNPEVVDGPVAAVARDFHTHHRSHFPARAACCNGGNSRARSSHAKRRSIAGDTREESGKCLTCASADRQRRLPCCRRGSGRAARPCALGRGRSFAGSCSASSPQPSSGAAGAMEASCL